MLYMVEMRLRTGQKEKAVEAFEMRGPNRTPGLSFRGAWIGSAAEVAFVLLESVDDAPVRQACEVWSAFGETKIQPVIAIENY